jgi:DNA-binding GntR family transcriptional regulator
MSHPVNSPSQNPADDTPTPTPTLSASDTVFFGLLKGLERRTFVPAQRLAETDLASQFGVGRNSVREALQRLAAEGIVELNRHRGASIRSLSAKETSDVLDVAEVLTGLLTRTAARAAGCAKHRAALKDALTELAGAHANGDAAAFGRARRHFYRSLLDMAESHELRRLFPAIQMPIVYAQFRLPNLQALRLASYLEIGNAVLSGDALAAETAGMAHVRRVRALIEQVAEQDS